MLWLPLAQSAGCHMNFFATELPQRLEGAKLNYQGKQLDAFGFGRTRLLTQTMSAVRYLTFSKMTLGAPNVLGPAGWRAPQAC